MRTHHVRAGRVDRLEAELDRARLDLGRHAVCREYDGPFFDLLEAQKPCLKAIVQICSVVREFISDIDELRLQRRAHIEKIFRKLRKFAGLVIPRVLDNSLAHLKGKIQPTKCCVSQLKVFHDAQCMEIMIEA